MCAETWMSQLENAEKRCAAQMSKSASLQQELDHYKAYMKKTVEKYKATIKDLKKKLKG